MARHKTDKRLRYIDKDKKVVDLTEFMGREAARRREGKVRLPKVYNIRLEVSEKEGVYHLEYDVSNKVVKETVTGREMMFEHLMMIVLSMSNDDPALIVELEESLHEYFFGDEQ